MKYPLTILLGCLLLTTATHAKTGMNAHPAQVTQEREITVKGTVTDELGEPLPGATVQQKGTALGTVTNFDGTFSLSVPAEATLVFSFVGYTSLEMNVEGKTELGNIMLIPETTELDQLVVIGYGTQRKVDLTGSVAIINTEELRKVSHSNHFNHARGEGSRRSNHDRRPARCQPHGSYPRLRVVWKYRTTVRDRWRTHGDDHP